MDKKTILCVEDSPVVQMMNKPLLESKGFNVIMATTIAEAWEAVKQTMPDIILLDIRLPDGNGLDFLRELRQSSSVPVIALTNNKEEQDIVEGLSSGCDDYIPKPYSLPILGARIDAQLRRAEKLPDVIIKGALTICVTSDEALVNGINLELPKKEFSLLCYFAQQDGRTLDKEYIYKKVWGQQMVGDDKALRNTVHGLRKKIDGSGFTIVNVRGKGYRFEVQY